MKNTPLLCAAAVAGLSLAACDEPRRDTTPETTTAIPEVVVEAAPAETDATAAAAQAPDAPPVDASSLSPEPPTSEETVRPESETLFY